MKAKKLIEILQLYEDYDVVSDSGWEVGPSDVGTVIADHNEKEIVLEQPGLSAVDATFDGNGKIEFMLGEKCEVLYYSDYDEHE